MTATITGSEERQEVKHRRSVRAIPADRLILTAALLPFVVAAVVLVVRIGSDYRPVSDLAFTELHTRDVGRGGVSVGLYSRDGWSHPGPILFYLLAPFYWLTGGASIGLNIGALVINGASVTGMALIARRRAGTALMLTTVLVCLLALRTSSAHFALDPWNLYITVLPFGLLIFLVWAMACGDIWALPVAAFVATFLAQTHVGFVPLALPLFGLGLAWLVIPLLWRGADPDRRRRLIWAVLIAAAVGVLWLPPLLEQLTHDPGNVSETVTYFRKAEGGIHTPADGVRVMVGQLELKPEWIFNKRPSAFPLGDSPFLHYVPHPWLLLPVIAAAVFLWRRACDGARQLLVVLGLAFVLGTAAVARTVGAAFDYRLRWAWVPAMLALAIAGWAAWLVADRFGPSVRRAVAALGLVALAAVCAVNVVTAATMDVPYDGESAVMAKVTPEVLVALGDVHGPVLVDDRSQIGAYFSRGMVLALERHGIDAVVPPNRAEEFGNSRVYRGGPLAARLLVTQDTHVAELAQEPGLRKVAEWKGASDAVIRRHEEGLARLRAARASGAISTFEYVARYMKFRVGIRETTGSQIAYHVAFFLEEPTPPASS